MTDLMNCLVGKVRKTRKGRVIITLTDLFDQQYGKVVLEDDFGIDLDSVDNVSLQNIYSKKRKRGDC